MSELKADILQQIKDWLAAEHPVNKDVCDAIGLLWAAHDEIKSLREKRRTEPNEALTVEELNTLVGKPIWANGLYEYCLVGRDKHSLFPTDYMGHSYPIKPSNGPYYRYKPEGSEVER